MRAYRALDSSCGAHCENVALRHVGNGFEHVPGPALSPCIPSGENRQWSAPPMVAPNPFETGCASDVCHLPVNGISFQGMIKSFRCRDTQKLFETGRSKSFGSISKVATRKLALLDAAATLDFLRSPPGNRLEALERDRAGQHSIRINDQWRVCFRWTAEGPEDVEIVDYH